MSLTLIKYKVHFKVIQRLKRLQTLQKIQNLTGFHYTTIFVITRCNGLLRIMLKRRAEYFKIATNSTYFKTLNKHLANMVHTYKEAGNIH
jgi:hypothetical protein